MTGIGNWTFTPLAQSFPSTILPNMGWWSASNGTWDYQIHVSWPLNWTMRNEAGLVETLYVAETMDSSPVSYLRICFCFC